MLLGGRLKHLVLGIAIRHQVGDQVRHFISVQSIDQTSRHDRGWRRRLTFDIRFLQSS